MASYAIMRVQKLKTNTAVRGSLKHAFRTIDTPNADSEKLAENSHLGAESVGEGMEKYKELLPDKIRKNGVRCLEYLMTASPEKMKDMSRQEQDAYFEDCKEWLEERHGKENVFYAGIHRDETTPHMYAYVVPLSQEKDQEGNLIKPGKLNAREFVGGHKNNLSELQTNFAEKVGKAHGMERGIKGSKAEHISIKKYYSELKDTEVRAHAIKQPRMLKKGVFINKIETKQDIIDRVADRAGELSQGARGLVRDFEEKDKTIKSLDSKLKEFETLRNLPEKDRKDLLSKAEVIKFTREQEKKQERERKAKEREERRRQKSKPPRSRGNDFER